MLNIGARRLGRTWTVLVTSGLVGRDPSLGSPHLATSHPAASEVTRWVIPSRHTGPPLRRGVAASSPTGAILRRPPTRRDDVESLSEASEADAPHPVFPCRIILRVQGLIRDKHEASMHGAQLAAARCDGLRIPRFHAAAPQVPLARPWELALACA